MISATDAGNISRLLKQLSRDSSTENTIAFLADNSGMLQSCKKILSFCRDRNEEARKWLQKECSEHGVQYTCFLQEIGQILLIFQSDDEKEDSYGVLGLSSSAGFDEVKRAYRRLSVQYHPDTAGNADRNTTEQFIQINKAYHNITKSQYAESVDNASDGTTQYWRPGKAGSAADRVKKKSLLWISVFILLSVLSCVVIAQIYSRKVMLSTLKQTSAAFVPPVKKSQEDTSDVAMTFAERMKIAETKEKAARLQEAETVGDKSAKIVEQSEPKVLTEKSSKQPDKVDSIPSKEPVRTIPVAVVAVDVHNTQPDKKGKRTAGEQVVEVKGEKGRGETVHADEDVTKKNRVEMAKSAMPLDVKKEDFSGKHELSVERTAKYDEPRIPEPVSETKSDTIKTTEVQPVVETPQVAASLEKNIPAVPDMQERIDNFLLEYCRAYADKNLMAFTRFFELSATENGKLIVDLMDTYAKLFESTKDLSLRISTLKWEEAPKGQVTLSGRFKIDLAYQNAEAVHGRGKIDFLLLVDDHGKLQIKTMNYSFDQ